MNLKGKLLQPARGGKMPFCGHLSESCEGRKERVSKDQFKYLWPHKERVVPNVARTKQAVFIVWLFRNTARFAIK